MPNRRINQEIFMRADAPFPYVSLVGTGRIEAADHATIQDLADAAFTAEAWTKITPTVSWPALFKKANAANNVGWVCVGDFGGTLFYGTVNVATTIFTAQDLAWVPDGKWHHHAMTWDDAGDRKVRIWKDGALYLISGASNVGAIITDVGEPLRFGHEMVGRLGWCRISNVVRYTSAFAAPSRKLPPSNDGSTVRLFKVNEMAGTDIVDYSTNAINATLVNGTWGRE